MHSFEFTGEEKVNHHGVTVRRIRATRDIPNAGVKKGDKGGWIESVELKDGNARVSGNAWVYGNAQVYGNARVYGNAQVSGNARVFGNAWVSGNAQVFGNAWVYGNARVSGNAWVYGNAQVYGNAWVYGNAQVYGNARVYGNAQVYGNARVYGNAQVSGNARVEHPWHLLVVGPIGSEGVTATLARTKNGKHILNVGCWDGTLGTLMAEVKRRRADWHADGATQDLWVAQYRALKALGKATVKRWK